GWTAAPTAFSVASRGWTAAPTGARHDGGAGTARSGVGGLVVGRGFRAFAEKKLFHLGFEEPARLRLDRRQPVLVDQHRLMREPAPPRELRDVLVDALPERARIWRPLEPLGLRAEHHAMHHPGHAESLSSSARAPHDRRSPPAL